MSINQHLYDLIGFYRDFGFCKFNEWCKFSHKVNKNTFEKDDRIKSLETKLNNVEKELEKKNYKILKLEEELQTINLNFLKMSKL